MKQILLIALTGLVFYPLGFLMNRMVMYIGGQGILYSLMAVLILVLWGLLANRIRNRWPHSLKIVIAMNFAGFVNLLLLFVQEILLHGYFENSIGAISQFYFLPLLRLGFLLSRSRMVFPAYASCWLLLAAASIIGCALHQVSGTEEK